MNRLSSDIRQARASANAWATGDIAALKEVAETDASYARSLAYSWPFLAEQDVQRLHDGSREQVAHSDRARHESK